MHTPHRPRTRFRALVAAACSAVLGAGLLAGAAAVAVPAPASSPADRKSVV